MFENINQNQKSQEVEKKKFIVEFEDWRQGIRRSPKWERMTNVEQTDIGEIRPEELSPEDHAIFRDVFMNEGKVLESEPESELDRYFREGSSTDEESRKHFVHFLSHALYFNKNILERSQGEVA